MKSGKEFPKFFLYLYIVLALSIFVGTFFSVKIVSTIYFITFIISIVYYFLDRKYGKKLSNYKQNFIMFDLINLVAIFSIIYYEFSKHALIIITFLALLMVIELLSLIFDFFFVKNENFVQNESIFIYLAKLGLMICILTYLFDVSDLWYAIIAFVVELLGLVLKIGFNFKNYKLNRKKSDQEVREEEKHKEEEQIEEMIQKSDNETEGDI